MNKDLLAIFDYLEREKGIKREIVIAAIEESLRAAVKKSVSHGGAEHVEAQINSKTGEIEIYVRKKIVEKVNDPQNEISLDDAIILAPECTIDQSLDISVPAKDFGRIAAQTARQIINQKLKGAERDVIYEEYRHRAGEIVSGTVKRFLKGRTLVVDLGKVEAILPERNYPITEKHHLSEKVQALLQEVRDTDTGGAEVILSRSSPDFVVELFKHEVPEVNDGTVTVKRVVREAGYRTKMAVQSSDNKVDPVGTCVGVRGARIKNIIRELNNEKIDVMPFSEDPIQLLQNALSPIEIKRIKVSPDRVFIVVNDEDYPAVLGKRGLNTRLISRMINLQMDVQKMSEHYKFVVVQLAELGDSPDPDLDQPLRIEGISSLIIQGLLGAGIDTLRKLLQSNPAELTTKVPGINYLDIADKILEQQAKKKIG